MIPRLIHQTTHDKEWALGHPRLRENIARLKSLNPGWDHRLYDDNDALAFIASRCGAAMARRFSRINPAYGPARADFFRYLLMLELGGVYLDLKSTARRPLDEVLRADDSYLLSHWRNGPGESREGWGLHPGLGAWGEFQQWHIAAQPGHVFLKAVVARVAENIDRYGPDGEVGKRGVLAITGPVAYTLAIRPLLLAAPHRLVDAKALGFVYDIFGNHDGREDFGRPHYRHLQEPVILPI
jgi:inositol phosphorylceramide mannosyltransferase catalytic subunit